jgi:hypothetical protein
MLISLPIILPPPGLALSRVSALTFSSQVELFFQRLMKLFILFGLDLVVSLIENVDQFGDDLDLDSGGNGSTGMALFGAGLVLCVE